MKNQACGGPAFRVATIATALALVLLLLVAPATATPTAPTKVGNETAISVFGGFALQFHVDSVRRQDGTYIAVWLSEHQDGDGHGVYMQLMHANRTKIGGEVQVHTSTEGPQGIAGIAAAADNSFVVCWYSGHVNPAQIFSQAFDSNGAKVGNEFQVSQVGATFPNFPGVAYLSNGDVVYCWSHSGTLWIRRFSPAFMPISVDVGIHTVDTPRLMGDPRIAPLVGGGFVIGYHVSNPMVMYFRLFTNSGAAIGQPTQLDHAEGSGLLPYVRVAARPDGEFIVTWNVEGAPMYSLIAARFSATGTQIGTDIIVASAPGHALPHDSRVTTFKDNSFVVAWQVADIFLQLFDANGNKVGAEVLVNTRTEDVQVFASLASNWIDNDFGVFYASNNHIEANSFFDIVGQWLSFGVAPTPTSQPPEISCISACLQYRCTEGALIDIMVTGVVTNDVYGTIHFADDSNVASAAVFAGLVADGETKTITVKCSGEQPSFLSGSAHGVTTEAYPAPWTAFTFDLGGETRAPPPPTAERCLHEGCAHNKCAITGTSFSVVVEGVVSNNVWGSSPFSDDSWVGAAAVHQGLLQVGSIGSVTVWCARPRESLTGSTQNGVASQDHGPWYFNYVLSAGATMPPPPPDDSCNGACLESNCAVGVELFLRVHGTTYGYLWGGGTAPYTEDTTVAAAAVHAGLVAPGEAAIVKATCTGPQSAFTGSTQHGVTTASYGPLSLSFTLSVGTPMPTTLCAASERCLEHTCTVRGSVMKVSVTGSTNPAVVIWGSTRFTSDSAVSHAAVHGGLVLDGETKVLYVTCLGPHDDFTASTANGVTSTAWATQWSGSFTLSTTL